MDPVVDRVRGTHCAYALELQGDDRRPFYVYCGHTAKDLEYRMLQHTQQAPGGAVFTKAHPPTGEFLSVCVHATEEDAMAAECAAWNLWAGKLGSYQQVRGGRYNGLQDLQWPPRGWSRDLLEESKCTSPT